MSAAESLGKMFQDKREKLGLERDDVASKTFINVKVITDIEAGVFEKLSPVYMKSFIKKYSEFLSLDTDEALRQYDIASRAVPVKTFSVEEKPLRKEKKEPPVKKPPQAKKMKKPVVPAQAPGRKETKRSVFGAISFEKKMQVVVAAVLLTVFAVLLVVLVNVTVKAFRSPRREVIPAALYKASAGENGAGTVSRSVAEKTDPRQNKVSSAVTGASVSLVLKASDRVWVQVASSEQGKLFDGFLNAGDSREWKTKGTLTVWTGKASVLSFKVNGRDLGVVATGVVRNIKVSAEGVLVGDDWVKRF